MADDSDPPLSGKTISHYRVLEKLGGGGMGVVYKAEDIRLGRTVSLKLLPERVSEDEVALQRLYREARAASALNHPNICTIHDVEEHNGQPFIVMEYLDGKTLNHHIPEGGLDIAELLDIGIQIADALDAAHEMGILHRDIKPTNIFVTRSGRTKLLDFGIAKPVVSYPEGNSKAVTYDARTLTQPGTVTGTVGYMSPEHLLGKRLDVRSDLFSLGAVLYEMAANRMAFSGTTIPAVHDAVLHSSPIPVTQVNPKIPAEFQRIVSKSMEKDPNLRYQTASDFRSDLLRLKLSISTPTPVVADWKNDNRRSKFIFRKKWQLPAAVGSLIVVLAFLWMRVSPFVASRADIKSIAVMPFENVDGGLNTQYICDSITESIIDSLSQLRGLARIPPWILVSGYKGKALDLDKIKRELNVDALLTGQVVRSGDSVAVTAQLTDIRNKSHVWSNPPYVLTALDPFGPQKDIAEKITESLQLRLSGEEKNKLEVYNLYQSGQYYWNKRTSDDLRKAIEYFNKVIAIDSHHARAHAGLANCYNLLSIYGGVSPAESFPKAKEEAKLALSIDDRLPEAHTALGLVRMYYDNNWAAAESEYKQAIRINDAYETAHQWYGEYLAAIGHFEAAEREMRRAKELDPLSLIISADLGWVLYTAGRSDDAIRELQATLQQDPNFTAAHWFLGWTYALQKRYAESIASLKQAEKLSAGNPQVIADLAHVYGISGQRAEALKVLAKLNGLSRNGKYVSQYSYAVVYTGLGEREKAFQALERACTDRPWELVNLKVDHRIDSLHSDARFRKLVLRLRIPVD